MPNFQKIKEPIWYNESGQSFPTNRLFKSEKLMEKSAERIFKEASNVNAELVAFKVLIHDLCEEVYEVFMAEKDNQKQGKGNFTWYNFDRSIKIEVTVNERIDFDDLTIEAAKAKLDEFLNANLDAKQEFIKDMVTEAFSTTRGKLDTKKVMSLLRYKGRIKDALFTSAMELIEQAIRRPESKTYYRVWTKTAEGSYENIELNFSAL